MKLKEVILFLAVLFFALSSQHAMAEDLEQIYTHAKTLYDNDDCAHALPLLIKIKEKGVNDEKIKTKISRINAAIEWCERYNCVNSTSGQTAGELRTGSMRSYSRSTPPNKPTLD